MEATSSLCSNEAHLWKYLNWKKLVVLEQVETHLLSATIVVWCSQDPILGSRLIYLNYWSWY